MLTLSTVGNLYKLEGDVKKAPPGFYWDSFRSAFVTPSSLVAKDYFAVADFEARRRLSKKILYPAALPRPLEDYPRWGDLKEIQKKTLRLALTQNRFYIALDMGLGKSVIACAIAWMIGAPVVIVTAPTLVEDILDKMREWAPGVRAQKLSEMSEFDFLENSVLVVPDTMLERPKTLTIITEFLRSHAEGEATLIIDEAHRFKNWDAQRSKALYGYWLQVRKGIPVGEKEPGLSDMFERVIPMSGSPADNGLLDLYAPLFNFAPETIRFANRHDYARYYCGAFKNEFGRWTLNGTPAKGRAEELGKKILVPSGSFMLRVKKKDSGVKLPPKVEEVFVLSGKMSGALGKIDESFKAKYKEDEDIIKLLIAHKNGVKNADEMHAMEYRRMLGVEKVKLSAAFLEQVLSDTKENILVFAIHTEVIAKLKAALAKYSPFVITGSTGMADRKKQVDAFQAGKGRVFIGNIQAMGVGLTLTKADRVVFVEYAWTPGANDQASDRAHRIGRNETVLVQYLVYGQSFDRRILEGVTKKRAIINDLERAS